MVIFLSATSTVPEGQSSAFSAASMSSLELIEAVTDISLGDTRPDVKSLLTEPDDGLNRLLSSQVDPVKVQDVHSVLRVLVLKPWLWPDFSSLTTDLTWCSAGWDELLKYLWSPALWCPHASHYQLTPEGQSWDLLWLCLWCPHWRTLWQCQMSLQDMESQISFFPNMYFINMAEKSNRSAHVSFYLDNFSHHVMFEQWSLVKK